MRGECVEKHGVEYRMRLKKPIVKECRKIYPVAYLSDGFDELRRISSLSIEKCFPSSGWNQRHALILTNVRSSFQRERERDTSFIRENFA